MKSKKMKNKENKWILKFKLSILEYICFTLSLAIVSFYLLGGISGGLQISNALGLVLGWLLFWMFSYLSLKLIRGEVTQQSHRVFQDGKLKVSFDLKKKSILPILGSVITLRGFKDEGKRKVDVFNESLDYHFGFKKGDVSLCFEVDVKDFPRGWLNLGGLTFKGQLSPFVPLSANITLDKVLVYPKFELKSPPLPFNSENFEKSENGYPIGTREFRRGDSIKSINWKGYAKKGDLEVFEYEEEIFNKDLILSYENVSGLEREKGISRLASWVREAHMLGISWSLSLSGGSLEMGSGQEHYLKSLDLLAKEPYDGQIK